MHLDSESVYFDADDLLLSERLTEISQMLMEGVEGRTSDVSKLTTGDEPLAEGMKKIIACLVSICPANQKHIYVQRCRLTNVDIHSFNGLWLA